VILSAAILCVIWVYNRYSTDAGEFVIW